MKTPSIVQLSDSLRKITCDHLVGRAVLEQQIVDLARGKMDGAYCQNWDRCENNWGKCSPDAKRWAARIKEMDIKKVLTAPELKILASLKSASR